MAPGPFQPTAERTRPGRSSAERGHRPFQTPPNPYSVARWNAGGANGGGGLGTPVAPMAGSGTLVAPMARSRTLVTKRAGLERCRPRAGSERCTRWLRDGARTVPTDGGTDQTRAIRCRTGTPPVPNAAEPLFRGSLERWWRQRWAGSERRWRQRPGSGTWRQWPGPEPWWRRRGRARAAARARRLQSGAMTDTRLWDRAALATIPADGRRRPPSPRCRPVLPTVDGAVRLHARRRAAVRDAAAADPRAVGHDPRRGRHARSMSSCATPATPG